MGVEDDGDVGPFVLVELDTLSEVKIADGVAAEDEDGVLADEIGAGGDAAGGAEGVFFDVVGEAHAMGGAVAEMVGDDVGEEAEGEAGVFDAVLFEEV